MYRGARGSASPSELSHSDSVRLWPSSESGYGRFSSPLKTHVPFYSFFSHNKDVSCEESHGSFITGESEMGVTGRVYMRKKKRFECPCCRCVCLCDGVIVQ